MECLIKEILKKHKKKTISLLEIQKYLPGDSDTKIFNNTIQKFVASEILMPSKSDQVYSINRNLLSRDKQVKIVQTQSLLQSAIQLDGYLNLPEEVWEKDYTYISLVEKYLMCSDGTEVSVPECSYFITGNEKWIDEKGGKEVLQRLGVWDKLPIIYYKEPLAIAINRNQINKFKKHLIVENKSIFYRILKVIEEIPIASLIYGEGWHVTGGMEMLYLQLGIKQEEKGLHQIYYFGDLDWEGLAIWHSISENVVLAVDFYKALLQQPLSSGKLGQKQKEAAIKEFLLYFTNTEEVKIKEALYTGKYIPQEALSTQEIIRIGRLL